MELFRRKSMDNHVEPLITEGLGYCCEWKFFTLFSNCESIGARLGISPRSIRKHKAAFAAGEIACEECHNCMKNFMEKKPR